MGYAGIVGPFFFENKIITQKPNVHTQSRTTFLPRADQDASWMLSKMWSAPNPLEDYSTGTCASPQILLLISDLHTGTEILSECPLAPTDLAISNTSESPISE